MAYVSVPNDLSKIKTKLAFNLTKRQLICFGAAAVIGIPAYLFTRTAIGNTGAMLLMIAFMLPCFFFAMYERDGLPFEKVVRNIVRSKFLWPRTRPYQTQNFYAYLSNPGKEILPNGAKTKRPPVPPRSAKPKKRGPQTAQQTIPYKEMFRDGICKVREGYYTKTLSYEDINYAVASMDDQSTIFDGYCSFLNYFDSALPFQLSFINHRSRPENRYSVNIPPQDDDCNEIRHEFTDMLKGQIARSNNGIVRSKYITFGIHADGIGTARPRLERIEADIMGNFKKLGVQSAALSGRERLEVLHSQLHPGGREPFRFSWDMIPKTGMGTKDFISPTSFDFRQSRLFRVGTTWGAASYMQIMASELSDKLLAELLEVDAEMTITMHIQTVDQTKAVKTVKAKLTDIDKMKMDEQKKAARAGYDIDILPPDLLTYSKDAAALLADLLSRNERMFLLTFLVVNTAPTRQQLENDIFTISGITQKYNCFLKRLDFQQEQGFMSSLPLGYNGIEIQRGMTTSSTAIFVPFMTQELRMDGQALYYGMRWRFPTTTIFSM